MRTGPVNDLITEAQQRRIFVRYTDKMEISRLSPIENHQGVVAIVEGKAGVELDELLLHLDTLSDPALVLVDSLRSQNFVCSCIGRRRPLLLGRHPASPRRRTHARRHQDERRRSEHLLTPMSQPATVDRRAQEKGIWVVAADDSGDLLYDEFD